MAQRRVSGGDYFRTGGIASRDGTFMRLSDAHRQSGAVPETIDAPRYMPSGGMTSKTTRDASGRVIPADGLVDRDEETEAGVHLDGRRVHWTPLEALEQARAAMPDAAFAARYSINPALIHRVSDVIEAAEAGRPGSERAVLGMLAEARSMLPRAWPENPPLDLFAELDRTIRSGCRELLNQYDARESVDRLYDKDDLFATALNVLIPDFEYPNHAHKSVGEICEVVAMVEREDARLALHERGVPVVASGRYIGSIVEIDNHFAVQNAGRGALVAHDLRKFESTPPLGEHVDVAYAGERAVVRGQAEPALSGPER